MKQLTNNLYVGNKLDCVYANLKDYKIVHTCKTCHKIGVGYDGSLSPIHPNYLVKELDNNLYLNMVDIGQQEDKYMRPMLNAFFNFMVKNSNNVVLIHCDQGESRAPGMALVYLAKIGVLPKDSYSSAKREFVKLYHNYNPKGIEPYLMKYWNDWVK
jgi:hypothetical protein